MLPPARAQFHFASGGRRGLGCGEDLCSLDRRCRVGPRLARFGFPGDDVEAVAAVQPCNKSLQPCPRFIGVHSGTGEGSVGVELAGSGVLARVVYSLDLGSSCVGVLPAALQPGMDWSSPVSCSGIAVGFVVARWVECFLLFIGKGSSSTASRARGVSPADASCCGSCQRFQAMEFLLASRSLSFFSGLGVHHGE